MVFKKPLSLGTPPPPRPYRQYAQTPSRQPPPLKAAYPPPGQVLLDSRGVGRIRTGCSCPPPPPRCKAHVEMHGQPLFMYFGGGSQVLSTSAGWFFQVCALVRF